MLACIGEQFEEGDEVCGVTVNIRAGKDRVELWSKTAANEAVQVMALSSWGASSFWVSTLLCVQCHEFLRLAVDDSLNLPINTSSAQQEGLSYACNIH